MNGDGDFQRDAANSEELQERLNRKIGRRNRLIVFTCVAISAVILLTVGFVCTKMFFTVDEIEVVCSDGHDGSEILAASGLQKGKVIFLVSTAKTEKQVLDAFPFIEKVELIKEYPNRLVLRTANEIPLFYYHTGNEDGGYAVVARSQKLLALCSSEPEVLEKFGKLLKVEMPSVKYAVVGEKLRYYERGDSMYIPELISSLGQFDLGAEPFLLHATSRFDIILYCGGNEKESAKYEILLGNKDQLEDKLFFAEGIIGQLEEGFSGIVSVEDPKNGYARPRKDA